MDSIDELQASMPDIRPYLNVLDLYLSVMLHNTQQQLGMCQEKKRKKFGRQKKNCCNYSKIWKCGFTIWATSWEKLFYAYANNKGADQNFKALASLSGCAGRFESYLVENPEDRFSHDESHIVMYLKDVDRKANSVDPDQTARWSKGKPCRSWSDCSWV